MSRLPMVLAGDIGGTKTLLGLFDARPMRPEAIAITAFATLDHPDLMSIVASFLGQAPRESGALQAACFGVAGPVTDNAATLTNVPRHLDGSRVAAVFNIPQVELMNDLRAMAYGVPALRDDELRVLQTGEPRVGGDMALLAAGTGLGEALLRQVNGRFVASPSESGHADFPARTEREIALLRDLTSRFGRVSVETVLSGNGLVNLHRFTHSAGGAGQDRSLTPVCSLGSDPAVISKAAIERSCPRCVEALEMFVDAYGAEAGNLALRTLSTGGIFVGGGIAPKILPALTDGRFVHAFNAKQPMDKLLETIPIRVILNAQVGLLGAAVYARGQMME